MHVPNSWRFAYPYEIIEFFSGFAFKSEDAQNHGIRWLKIANVGVGKIKWDEESFLPVEYSKVHKRYMLNVGDIVVAMTRPTLGNYLKIARIEKEEERSLLNQRVAKIVIKDGGDPNFIFQLFRTENIAYRINTALLGTDPPNLSISVLKDFKVGIPTLTEQQKIAQILSTWDKAIEKLEALIAAKQKRKKALMQQLLTGKLQFAGFDVEWKDMKLIEVAQFRRGSFPQPYGLPEWYDELTGLPFIQVYDIDEDMKLKPTTKNRISKLAAKKSVFIQTGTIIVSLQGSIGRVAITQYDAYVDRTVLLFQKFLVPTNNVFFAYILQELFELEKEKAPGGTIKTITKEALSNFIVKIPYIQEQNKIASVLSAADTEIQTHQKHLSALKQQKKGLMQQLLTGKKRVKLAESA